MQMWLGVYYVITKTDNGLKKVWETLLKETLIRISEKFMF